MKPTRPPTAQLHTILRRTRNDVEALRRGLGVPRCLAVQARTCGSFQRADPDVNGKSGSCRSHSSLAQNNINKQEFNSPDRYRPSPGPVSNLDTRNGFVTLPSSEFFSNTAETLETSGFGGLATTLLNDGKCRSAAELEDLRSEILEIVQKTFSTTEKLNELLSSPSAFFEKHETLRHPPIFYFGHAAAFYVNKLFLGGYLTERVDPQLEIQMAVGVDEMSWDDLDSNSYVWPSGEEARADPVRTREFLQKVLDFRREVRVRVERLIKSKPMEWPIEKNSLWYTILMCIEHERIHIETSSCILRQATLSNVKPHATFPICDRGRFHTSAESVAATTVVENSMVPIPAGITRIGRPWAGTKTYGWDNEFGKENWVDVDAFAASKFLVSNKEYLDFVEAGGYRNNKYWTEEGWRWVSDMKPEAPRFWRRSGEEFRLRTLAEEIPMPWDWPVEVCHLEAAAFCKYKSMKTGKTVRLPMEDEYLRLRDSVPTDLQDSAHGPSWGTSAPGNVNLSYWASPCPVDTFESPTGVFDVLGNVWQHCSTHIDVLEGFETHPLYDDFTTPTIGEHHSRIMGGSWMSLGCNGATRDGRYGFRRHFYQHAGFRYVETNRPVTNAAQPYERERNLCDAYRFHFDKPVSGDCFHTALASSCAKVCAENGLVLEKSKFLELGCGPGRTVLELAKLNVAAVHGGDRSAYVFRGTAEGLLSDTGRLRWTNYTEGEFIEHREIVPGDVGVSSKDERIHFYQMPDMAAIDGQKFHDYDVVLIAQPGALGGASDPIGVLSSAHKLLKPGGILAIGTQYEWPSSKTAFGTEMRKDTTSGEQVVEKILSPWFESASSSIDLPYIRSETIRKTEKGLQHLTFWKRREMALESPRACWVPSESGEIADLAFPQGQDVYEDQSTGWRYLDFHFGPSSAYPSECAARCIGAAKRLGVPLDRALDVGGGPGRAAMELSKAFKHVDGGDYSRVFVEHGNTLLNKGEIHWCSVMDETSGFSVERSARKHDLEVGSVALRRLDAMNLDSDLTNYDLICGFNLLDRLARPRDFLKAARDRINPGGLLVLSSPYTWLEDFTPKEEWLGGFKYGDNDGPTSYAGLKEYLQELGFVEALAPEDLPFSFEEFGNGRKTQQTRAQVTYWRFAE